MHTGGQGDGGAFRTPGPGELSVVVSAHALNRWLRLRQTLRDVLQQSQPVREVLLVVDDNDHLVAAARAVFPVITVLPNEREPGTEGSVETGIAHAGGRLVTFLDDTAALTPDWSRLVVEAFDAPEVVAAGGRIGRPRPRPSSSWWPPMVDGASACGDRGLPLGRPVLAAMTAAQLTVRKDVLTEPDVGCCLHAERRAGQTPGGTTWTYRAAPCTAAAPAAQAG